MLCVHTYIHTKKKTAKKPEYLKATETIFFFLKKKKKKTEIDRSVECVCVVWGGGIIASQFDSDYCLAYVFFYFFLFFFINPPPLVEWIESNRIESDNKYIYIE